MIYGDDSRVRVTVARTAGVSAKLDELPTLMCWLLDNSLAVSRSCAVTSVTLIAVGLQMAKSGGNASGKLLQVTSNFAIPVGRFFNRLNGLRLLHKRRNIMKQLLLDTHKNVSLLSLPVLMHADVSL